jgi:hypothetical protein
LFKRLAVPTGELADQTPQPNDSLDRIVRPAILVHSGPDGRVTRLASSDGDIEFDEERIRSVVQNHNEMVSQVAAQYGGFEKMPVGAYAPILDQHNDDSNDRIRGRLTGLLRFERRDVPKVGQNVACAVADITFLGPDTVSKVKNGLIYHLSVGIDEGSNTLGEVSCVIEPAAPGAMLLRKRKNLEGKKKMPKAKLARLQKLNGELKELSAKAAEQQARVRLAKAKADVTARFTKLMTDKKVSPAEFKKLDIARLAKLDTDSLDSIVHVYEAREALIKNGQQGSTSATNFSDVGGKMSEDKEVRRMKLAARQNLEKQGVKFKALAKAEAEDEASEDEEEDKEKKTKKLAAENIPSMTDDLEHTGDETIQGQEEIAQQVEENAAQIARVASMVDAIIQDLQSEGEESELSKDDEEEAPEKDEEEKSDDDKKDDDKKELSEDDKKDEKGDGK